ncbi:MAG: aromatic aminobenezylarsenical efflux permease ArsG family transporter [Candidatus Sumerlaeaceae bacterium]|nr:aromatic aminobenezylarsenical efflux permease ArsG family transporter [Candidatus Sumerlaeaceae bacterium]
MDTILLGLASAFWLGLLTAISPCPLASNIAAITYVSRHVGDTRRVFLAGLLYMAGRAAAYVLLGALLVWGLLQVFDAATGIQRVMNVVFGPLLIVMGLLLAGLLPVSFSFGIGSEAARKLAERAGALGPAILGFVFAMAFCPVSAGLFFGSLIPLSLQHQSVMMLPTAYGVATALPVAGFALAVALGANALGKTFNKVTQFEAAARRVTAIVFIGVGVLHILRWNLNWV